MATVYAIANQKGGVGKTTTAVNLAACVAEAGYDTLLVDIDPQCNATLGLGISKDAATTVYDVLAGSASFDDVLVPTSIEHLWVAPAGPDLAGATVDYHDDLNRRGFSIVNPSAKSTCGCGSSYSM